MTVRSRLATIAGLSVAAGVSFLTTGIARRSVESGPQAPDTTSGSTWLRTNHAGRTVSLLEGPAASVAALAGLIVEGALSDRTGAGRRAAATGVAVAGAAAVGLYDDLAGTVQAKGFRGHAAALAEGRLTSGLIKVVGVGAAALAAALIDPPGQLRRGVIRPDLPVNVMLIAGTANLINLLDLRPGRAAKVIIVATTPLLPAIPGTGPLVGAAGGAAPEDLAGHTMLGDCGANGLGAGLGVTLTRLPWAIRLPVLAAVVGLNLASEKVSFTQVIESNPVLRTLDEWGRPLARREASHGPDAGADRDGDDG